MKTAIRIANFALLPSRAGVRPSGAVVARLHQLHPRVDLWWNVTLGKWSLVEKGKDGHFYHLKAIEGEPTFRNTVQMLGAMVKAYYGLDDFEENLDRAQVEKDRDAARNTADASAEAAHKLAHASGLFPKVAVGRVPWSAS